MAFQFRLQRVLKYRETIEDTRKKEFAEISRIYELEAEKLRSLQEEQSEKLQELGELQRGILNLLVILFYHAYLGRLRTEIDAQAKRVEEVRLEKEQKREALIQASKDKKVLERLRERELEAYQKEEDRKLQIFMDEIGTSKAAREKHEERDQESKGSRGQV